MASKYVQVYEEIYNGNGVINERVRMVMRKHSVPLTFKSFLRMYQAWRNHNYGGEKLQDHIPEVRKMVQPTGQLDKLKYSLGAFDEIVNELKPDVNTFDLPASLESNYQPYKLPTNHNDILLLSDIHVPYHNNQHLHLR